MAIYNEILVARYARLVQKLLGIKGTAPMKQVSGELSIALPIFFGCENRFLESWDRFAVNPSQAAVAAQRSTFQIRNPRGSNVIAVLERVIATPASADIVTLNFQISTAVTDTDLTTVDPSFNLDSRSLGQSSNAPRLSTCVVSNQAAAGAPRGNGPILAVGAAANLSADFVITDIQELVLAPGTVYEVTENTANVQLRVGFLWRERFLEESERQ